MTKYITAIVVLIAAAASFGLYQLSYEVQRLGDELVELNRAVMQDRESILVLSAEWSYLTRPAGLQDKAARLLELRSVSPKQVQSLADVPTRQERLKQDATPQPTVIAKNGKPAPAPKQPQALALPAVLNGTVVAGAQKAVP